MIIKAKDMILSLKRNKIDKKYNIYFTNQPKSTLWTKSIGRNYNIHPKLL